MGSCRIGFVLRGPSMSESVEQGERRSGGLLPRGVIVAAAFLGAVVVAAVSLLGPMGLGMIQYRTSQSGIWQAIGVDAVNLIIMVPALVIGGTLLAMHRDGAKYFLILAPVTLFSLALEAGAGQEWNQYV